MKSLIIGLLVVLGVTGCSGVKPKVVAEEMLRNNSYGNKVTTVCYDLINKKDCPDGMRQIDRQVVPFWGNPLTSRFCFGFTKKDLVIPTGMYCYSRDIIK